MKAIESPFAPIGRVSSDDNVCWLWVDPLLLDDHVRLERLKLMLAAVYEGVEVLGNTNATSGSAHVAMHRNKFIGPMDTITLASINRRLADLPKQPVRLLQRGPKVMQWLLVVDFRPQVQHLDELRRIPGIMNAIVTPDSLYDGRLVELFIPEDPYEEDAHVPAEGQEASEEDDSTPAPFIVHEGVLRKQIEETLNFDLTPDA